MELINSEQMKNKNKIKRRINTTTVQNSHKIWIILVGFKMNSNSIYKMLYMKISMAFRREKRSWNKFTSKFSKMILM